MGPDGSCAEPNEANVPYKPTKYLRASTTGVSEGDFVFLLGFPGTTMRYAPSSRLAYADEVAVPALVSDFARKLSHIETHSVDRGASLKMYTHKFTNANDLSPSPAKIGAVATAFGSEF